MAKISRSRMDMQSGRIDDATRMDHRRIISGILFVLRDSVRSPTRRELNSFSALGPRRARPV
jgi:hypothetical protein